MQVFKILTRSHQPFSPFNSHLVQQYVTQAIIIKPLHNCLLAFSCGFFQKVPLFADTNLPFIRRLCTKVKPAQIHENEYLVRSGDIGQEMFIIRKGLVRTFIWLPVLILLEHS